MKKYITHAILIFTFIFGSFSYLTAQEKPTPGVKIGGEVTRPLVITLKDVQKMPRVSITRLDRDNKTHQYTGVSLSVLLKNSGATTGKDLRGENLTKYVIAEASDGYQVIFSLAEVDSEFNDSKIILADTVDNSPLPTADGPFRIIVENDKRPARCIKQVNSIRVGFAK